MSEAVYQPTIEEETFTAYDGTSYEEVATFELAQDDPGDASPSRFGRLLHEYGARAGAVVLTGVMVVGLAGCKGESDRPDSVKGMVIEHSGSQVTLGTCVKKKVAFGYGESDLRNAGVDKVRTDARKNGCTSTLSGAGENPNPCTGPSNSFIRGLKSGAIVVKKSTVDLSTNDMKCSWVTH